MKIDNNLGTAIMAASKAGEAIMEVYNSKIEVEIKDDKSPLTEADKRANAIINFYLQKTEIPIISEENKQISFETRKYWDTCWIVDPLDGTKEFIKRNGEFTVNIALIKGGKPVLGVIYAPYPKILYYASTPKKKGYKLKLNQHTVDFSKLHECSELLVPKQKSFEKVKVVGSRSHMNKDTLSFVNELKRKGFKVDIVSKGSSLKFCLVAEGKADNYPRFAPTMEWDTAAGQAICNAVGVDVISKDTGKELRYNKENLLNPSFLVSKN